MRPAPEVSPRPTGRTVVAFGVLAALGADERAARLADVASEDPALAAQLEALLGAREEGTRVLTGFADGPRHAPRATVARGRRLGDFELVERIGDGGMGEVWRARQRDPERDVALKVLFRDHPELASLSGRTEKRALAALRHPAIAAIHASGIEEDGTTWIAMEFVDGARDLVSAARDLPLPARVRLLADVADGVAHAHANGFIHRDLKPSNVVLGSDGRPRIIDFGIAATLSPDASPLRILRMGTPAYMPPEALDDDPVALDVRADVYALGAILHEAIHGALPAALASDDPLVVLRAIGGPIGTAGAGQAPPSTIFHPPPGARRAERGDLAAIVARATARDPDARYRTAAALAEDLRAYLEHRPIDASPPGAVGRLRLAARRNPVAASLAAAAAIALVAGTAASLAFAADARRAAREFGELATQTGRVQGAFLDLFLPSRLDPDAAANMSVADYLRSRVGELESMAGESALDDRLADVLGLAQTLQYSCLSLDLVDEAERCAAIREVLSARLVDPRSSLPAARHLDAAFTRLARDPSDRAALAAIDALIPRILAGQRLVRAGSLSVIGGVDFLHETMLSEIVADRLIEHADGSPETLSSAVARLALAVHAAAEGNGPIGERERRMLFRAAAVLGSIVKQASSPAAIAEARAVASALDLRFCADLVVARHPILIDPLLELAIVAGAADGDARLRLNFFEGVPLRLAEAGAWESCAAAIAALEARASSSGRSLGANALLLIAIARARLASALDDMAGLANAARILDELLSGDPAPDLPAYDCEIHAAALVAAGELALRTGDLDALARAEARARNWSESLVGDRSRPGRGSTHREALRTLGRLRNSVPRPMPGS